ncbi:putative methyltransferase-domain-containing protein [Chlamydoabsidia padenii]|nr:putative methyltransferase-domain-containing protein [Chlamydoabsidia padenii]
MVNEIGLFKRADIEPEGRVYLGCDLLVPSSADSLAPLTLDTTCDITLRPSTWSGAAHTTLPNTGVAGFLASGKGAFEYTITPKQSSYQQGPRYLRIYCRRVEHFPRLQEAPSDKLDDWILPLVVGPLLLSGDTTVDVNHGNTHFPIESWQPTTLMVHSSYRLFNNTFEDNNNNVAIHESWESGIPGKIWDSALVMSRMLEQMAHYKPDYLDGKHILDLSAGTGLLGLSVAKNAQPSKVTITELDEATDLIKSNISLNQYLIPKCPILVKPLLWGSKSQASACGKADIILASDVLYESEFFQDLVKSFVDLCNTPSGKIYIGYKRRGFDAEEETRFWELCRQYFDITLLNTHPSDEDAFLVPSLAITSGVQLYRLTLRSL